MKAVIDTETGGLVAGWNEVLEITILPLDEDYRENTSIPMFHTTVRPDYIDRVELQALVANGRVQRSSTTKDQDFIEAKKLIMEYPTRAQTVAAFCEWHKTYVGKQIAPLAHNWRFDFDFLNHWFMPSHQDGVTIASFFNYQARDTQIVAMSMCDRAKANGAPLPFGGVSLTKLTEKLGIEHSTAHTSLGDARATAAVYRRLMGIDKAAA